MKNITLDSSILGKLHSNFYSKQDAKPLLNPKLVSVNEEFALDLGFDKESLYTKEFLEFTNGRYILEGSTPYSNAYSGHQFGYFVPDLGDGRALNLGKLNGYYLQLKGSGTTRYSRHGDGRAILRSSIREYLVSEAMHGLGIPTTRALAIITSDTKVLRDYEQEQGAIVLRASSSWMRFGSFEFAYINKKDNKHRLKNLADYVIEHSYPELKKSKTKYEELFYTVVDRTVELLALWQSVGFMHGVMNTDNMSIEGLTIDYGPYAFMEEFDKGFICNLSDKEGRYSFENQPFIAQWNLSVLAKVLSPIANHEMMEKYNDTFIEKFKKRYFELMANKIGLDRYNYEKDGQLLVRMFKAMSEDKIDYTSFFYELSHGKEYFEGENISKWIKEYKVRIENNSLSKDDRLTQMQKLNPKYIFRNYMLQDAIDAAEKGNFQLVNDFLEIAKNPFGEFKEYEMYTQPKSGWKALKCSCSS